MWALILTVSSRGTSDCTPPMEVPGGARALSPPQVMPWGVSRRHWSSHGQGRNMEAMIPQYSFTIFPKARDKQCPRQWLNIVSAFKYTHLVRQSPNAPQVAEARAKQLALCNLLSESPKTQRHCPPPDS